MSVLIAGYVKELSTGDILKLQSWQLIGLVVKLILKKWVDMYIPVHEIKLKILYYILKC